MPESPQSYMQKVSALCARPDLSSPADRITFLIRLQAYWTRQLNSYRKGKPTKFPPADIHDILDALHERITHERSAQ